MKAKLALIFLTASPCLLAADPSPADAAIKAAADKGNPSAEGTVAGWYLDGLDGHAKDPVEAASWFRKAANQGDAVSQRQLGQLYVAGNGVTRDYSQALVWFLKAANQGDPRACVWVGVACEQGIAGMPKDKAKAIEWYKKAGDEPKAKEFLARLGAQ